MDSQRHVAALIYIYIYILNIKKLQVGLIKLNIFQIVNVFPAIRVLPHCMTFNKLHVLYRKPVLLNRFTKHTCKGIRIQILYFRNKFITITR